MAASEHAWWSHVNTRRSFAAGGMVLALATASVASWAATTGHDHGGHDEAAGGHGHGDGDVHTVAAPDDHHGEGAVPGHGDHPEAASGSGRAPAHGHAAAPNGDGDHAGHDGGSDAPAVLGAGPSSAGVTGGAGDTVGRPEAVKYGPFVLPPADLGGTRHQSLVVSGVPKPCDDCYLTSMRADLVDESGHSVNLDDDLMLHHMVLTQADRDDPTCGRSNAGALGLRFFAAGNERTEGAFPDGFGYYVSDGPWNLIVELMNHGDAGRTVFVSFEVTWRPGSDPVKPLTPLWLDVDNCFDSEYSVPAGPSDTPWRWTSNVTGRVVFAGGHVHDGGIATDLRNQTTGEHLCRSSAGYGTNPAYEGSVESMSTCVWDHLGTVRAGEVLEMRTTYDVAEARSDVMGIMIVFVHETTNLDGGTPAPGEAKSPSSGSTAPPPRGAANHHH